MSTNLCEDGSDYSYLLIIQHPQGFEIETDRNSLLLLSDRQSSY